MADSHAMNMGQADYDSFWNLRQQVAFDMKFRPQRSFHISLFGAFFFQVWRVGNRHDHTHKNLEQVVTYKIFMRAGGSKFVLRVVMDTYSIRRQCSINYLFIFSKQYNILACWCNGHGIMELLSWTCPNGHKMGLSGYETDLNDHKTGLNAHMEQN